MTPSLIEVSDTFAKVATEKNINLDKVDINWLGTMIEATQICNFKTEQIFLAYVEKALSNIPPKAILK